MIALKKNGNAVNALLTATFQEKSAVERKPLYVETNAFNDVSLDSAIYRIVPVNYFLNDVRGKILTHTQIGPKMWGDTYENPLTKRQFYDNVSDTYYDLRNLLDAKFGVCWSTDPEESLDNWDDFSHGLPAVRMQTTPRKLLSAVMNVSNPFFMLHHFIGKINYCSAQEIDAYISKPDVADYLDSLGQELAFSVMNLRNHHSHEQEVRLVYSHSPDGSDWVKNNVQIRDGLCRLPFQWDGVLTSIIVGPNVEDGGEGDLISTLKALGYDIPVWSSSFRQFIG